FDNTFNGLSRPDSTASPASSANMSTILTPPARCHGFHAGVATRDRGRSAVKASHNGYCVTLEPRPRYNMSHETGGRGLWHGHCLDNTRQGRAGPRGEGQKARDSKKAWVRSGGIAQPDTRPADNNNKTLLHTQA